MIRLSALCRPMLRAACAVLAVAAALPAHAASHAPTAGLPLAFEANQGQVDAQVRYLARAPGYHLFLTADEAVMSLPIEADEQGRAQRAVLRAGLLGASAEVIPTGEQELPGRAHYFTGHQPSDWTRNVVRYGRVRYPQVYPGVDLVYYGDPQRLEFDFELAPGADPDQIRLQYRGVRAAALQADGGLRLDTLGGASLRLQAPLVYQLDGAGQRQPVAARYRPAQTQDGRMELAFELGAYDAGRALVIDPVVLYATYFGGDATEDCLGEDDDDTCVADGTDRIYGLRASGSGQAFIVGETDTPAFPSTDDAYQTASTGGTDAFIAGLSADGQSLLFATYLGGSPVDCGSDEDCVEGGGDSGRAIALGSDGSVYVTGTTSSVDFPVANAAQDSLALEPNQSEPTGSDAFVTKLGADGGSLIYSSYLGGSYETYVDDGEGLITTTAASETGYAIAVDSQGRVTVVGSTNALDFPVENAFQDERGNSSQTTTDTDVFVARFSASGSTVEYASYLGGSKAEGGADFGLAVDSLGRAWLCGQTQSSDFPQFSPIQAAYGGGLVDAFVARVSADGSALEMSSFLGGSGSSFNDEGYGIAIDSQDRAVVVGATDSSNFPVQENALYPSRIGSTDGFIVRITGNLVIDYSSYFGGTGSDRIRAVAVDATDNIYLAGETDSTDFPLQDELYGDGGSTDAFVSVLAEDGQSLLFSSYFGGTDTDRAFGVAYDGNGGAVIGGITNSDDLPIEDALIPARTGDKDDGFIARFEIFETPDPSTLALSDASYSVNEDAGTLTVSVTRSGSTEGAVSVDYATVNGSAIAGTDYTAASGTLNWANGDDAVKTFDIPITDDTSLDGNLEFSVELSSPGGGAQLGEWDTAAITILDDEDAQPGTLAFEQAEVDVSEGGSAVLLVSRSGGSDGPASVEWSAEPGSATAGDYQATGGTLSWDDGDDRDKTITIPIIDDTAEEDAETFSVTLSNESGATLGTQTSATVTIAANDAVDEAPGTLGFDPLTYDVDETGGSVTLTVTRSGGTSGTVSLPFTTVVGSAEPGGDYGAEGVANEVTGTLEWNDGDDGAREITIPIIDDTDVEDVQTFSVVIEDPTQGEAVVDELARTAQVNITSDDVQVQPGTLLIDTSIPLEASESAGQLTVSVLRFGGSDGEVSVHYATGADGDTATDDDYESTSGDLTWGPGDDENKTFTVTLNNDTLDEIDETFAVTLSDATNGAQVGDPATATATIFDDDGVQAGTFRFTPVAYDASEAGESVMLTVTRINGGDGDVSVHYESADVSAQAGSDYVAVEGELTWSNGEYGTEYDKTIEVELRQDAIYEGNETFTVTLSDAQGVATIGDGYETATVTMADDEIAVPGTLQFAAGTASVDEDADMLTLNVTRENGSDGAVTVNYSTSNSSATAGIDYLPIANGTLSWAAGDTQPKPITIQILNDSSFEAAETFAVTLSNATSGASVGDPMQVQVTINDDEQVSTLQFGSASASVVEGQGSLTVTVTRSGGSTGEVSVHYATAEDGATEVDDYSRSIGTLTWANGDAEDQTITVPITDDQVYEGAEAFSIVLSNPNPTGAAELGAQSTLPVTIDDNDPPAYGSLQLAGQTLTVSEDGTLLEVQVTRINGSDGAVSIHYATDDSSAEAGGDYGAASGTLNWGNGDEAPKTFSVAIVNDALLEGDETFTVNLSDPGGGATQGSPSSATVLIQDDESPQPGTPQFSLGSLSVDENAGTVSVEVLRGNGSDGDLTVQYATIANTATDGDDYTGISGVLSWKNGDTDAQTLTVPIRDDGLVEGTEDFSIALSEPSSDAVLGNIPTVTVSIQDNDIPSYGALQFVEPQFSINENGGQLMVGVARVGGGNGEVSVAYTTRAFEAINGTDYQATSGTLSWDDGDTETKSFSVTIIDDGLPEADEKFSLELSDATGGAALGSVSTATAMVVDDDEQGTAAGELRFGAASYTVTESGGGVTVAVTRSNGSTGTISVGYRTVNGTAASGVDYVATSGTLVWNDGDTDANTITVKLLDDTAFESAEYFSIVLENPTSGAEIAGSEDVMVTIDDGGETGSAGDSDGSGAFDLQWLALLLAVSLLRTANRNRRMW